jgi:hypothetical protein
MIPIKKRKSNEKIGGLPPRGLSELELAFAGWPTEGNLCWTEIVFK